MNCPNCNAEVNENEAFCANCGHNLTQGANQAQSPAQEQKVDENPSAASGKTESAGDGKVFCSECGTQLSINDKFCPVCGNPTADNTGAPIPQQQINNSFNNNATQQSAPSDNKNDSNFFAKHLKQIIIGASGIVILLLLIFACKTLFSKGYTKPIKDMIKTYNSQSTDISDYFAVATVWGEAATDYFKTTFEIGQEIYEDESDDLNEAMEKWSDSMDTYYDKIADKYGEDWKISYKLKKATKLRDAKLEDYQDSWDAYVESLEDELDDLEDDDDVDEKSLKTLEKTIKKLEKKKIKKGYKVKAEFKIKGSDDEDSKTSSFYVLKINNDWIIYDAADEIGLNEMMGISPYFYY